ncbi:MAG TPA: phosphoribosyltransferase family protein [Gemmatimonadales bacterium]|nr:phosphoribosyltransferase family protein [Gemmatimonadales bacterium]
MGPIIFEDRFDAGRRLGDRMAEAHGRENVVVLGLPRGGVPVAFEIASRLGAPLDVFLVRKLGVPGREELAMGALASGGVRLLNEEIVHLLHIPPETLERVTEAERRELARRERAYGATPGGPAVEGKTVVLVDDGVATGSTMLAAIAALRRKHPAMIVAAAPVMSAEARAAIGAAADGCVCLEAPEPFHAVGAWYHDFGQTSDEEVQSLLRAARARRDASTPAA